MCSKLSNICYEDDALSKRIKTSHQQLLTQPQIHRPLFIWHTLRGLESASRCSPSITLQQKYACSTWFYFDLVEKNNNTLIDLLYTRTIVGWLTAHNCYFIQTLYQHNYLHEERNLFLHTRSSQMRDAASKWQHLAHVF